MRDYTLLDNSLRTWLIAAAVAVTVYAVLFALRLLVLRNLTAVAARTSNELDDIVAQALRNTRFFFLLFVSLYAGARVLVLPAPAATALRMVGVVVVFLQAALWGNVVISVWVQRQMTRRLDVDPASATTINALGFISRLALYTLLVLLALANLGIEITPLLAGLGVGGIAVALALQNILGDLFASLSIVLDRPFALGDFIIVGDLMGTVEYIGLKTTRVRSLSGEQLVFANSDLLGARIRNFQRMQERRVVFSLGVTYQTSRAALQAIPQIVREAVEMQPNVRFDRAHFKSYGDFALDFEIVYYVLSQDFNVYMDVQQAINLEIHRRFEDSGIEFAYPTQTLFLSRAG